MVYKKYIKRNGKLYGPYLYHNVKKNGRVITSYHGKSEEKKNSGKILSLISKDNKKFFLVAGFLVALILILSVNLLFLLNFSFTGKVSVDLQEVYLDGENLKGDLNLVLKHGEFFPSDTMLVVDNAGEISEFNLMNFLDEEIIENNFYIEGKDVVGFGEGFGFVGEKEIYPEVTFSYRIVESSQIVSGGSGGASEGSGEIPVIEDLENKTEEVNDSVEEVSGGEVSEIESGEDFEEDVSGEDVEVSEDSNEVVESQDSNTESSSESEDSILESGSDSSEVGDDSEDSSSAESSDFSGESSSGGGEDSSSSEPSNSESSEESGSVITGEIVGEDEDLIVAKTSKENSFELELNSGEKIEIVYTTAPVEVSYEDNKVIISTDYSEIESGFGNDYLTEDLVNVPISFSDLDLVAKQGELKISFVYDGVELISEKKDIEVLKSNETFENKTIEFLNETNFTKKQQLDFILDKKKFKLDSKIEKEILKDKKVRVILKVRPGEKSIGKKLGDLNLEFVEVDLASLDLLGDEVEEIVIDQPVSILLEDSEEIIQSKFVRENFSLTGVGEKICVIDSGVDENVVSYVGGYDFVDDDFVPDDVNGHGTEVSYVISTIAPGAELYVVKVIDENGIGYESDVLAAIDWCVGEEVDVISFSIGAGDYSGFCDSNIVAEFVNEVVDDGVLVVAAVGNDGTVNLKSPACASSALRVGATDKEDGIAEFSNVNFVVDLFAPGKNILTKTLEGIETSASGTSMSAPMVAGASALVLENESLSTQELKERLKTTGKPIEFEDINISRIDVYNAVLNISTMNLFNETLNQSEVNETNVTIYEGLSTNIYLWTGMKSIPDPGCTLITSFNVQKDYIDDADIRWSALTRSCSDETSKSCKLVINISGREQFFSEDAFCRDSTWSNWHDVFNTVNQSGIYSVYGCDEYDDNTNCEFNTVNLTVGGWDCSEMTSQTDTNEAVCDICSSGMWVPGATDSGSKCCEDGDSFASNYNNFGFCCDTATNNWNFYDNSFCSGYGWQIEGYKCTASSVYDTDGTFPAIGGHDTSLICGCDNNAVYPCSSAAADSSGGVEGICGRNSFGMMGCYPMASETLGAYFGTCEDFDGEGCDDDTSGGSYTRNGYCCDDVCKADGSVIAGGNCCGEDSLCSSGLICGVDDKCKKVNGESCTQSDGSECASGNCVDGYCCNTPCDGTCYACSATKSIGADGVCSPVDSGTDPDTECSATSCGTGNCNGAGACGWYTSGEHGCTTACKTCSGATSTSCVNIANNNQDTEGSYTCDSTCKKCSSGSCVNQGNEDLFNQCDINNNCATGNCKAGAGVCDWYTIGDGACPTCNTCNGATSTFCSAVTAETGNGCTSNCFDCVAGNCIAMTEDNDGSCSDDCNSCVVGSCTNRAAGDGSECGGTCQACDVSGGDCSAYTGATGTNCESVDTYCCSGSCVNPYGTPSEYGGACGSGDCSGGIWECSGTIPRCSSYNNPCDFCSGDYRYTQATCISAYGALCYSGSPSSCPACKSCRDYGTTTGCVATGGVYNYYDNTRDTHSPNLCNQECKTCNGAGSCVDQDVGEDLFNQCAIGSWSACLDSCTKLRDSGNCAAGAQCAVEDESGFVSAGMSCSSGSEVNSPCNSAWECSNAINTDNAYNNLFGFYTQAYCDGTGGCDYSGLDVVDDGDSSADACECKATGDQGTCDAGESNCWENYETGMECCISGESSCDGTTAACVDGVYQTDEESYAFVCDCNVGSTSCDGGSCYSESIFFETGTTGNCCGNNGGENYINSTMGQTNYVACCDDSTDCAGPDRCYIDGERYNDEYECLNSNWEGVVQYNTCYPTLENADLRITSDTTCDSGDLGVRSLNVSSGKLTIEDIKLTVKNYTIIGSDGTMHVKNSKNTIWQNGNLTISGNYILEDSTLRINGTGTNGNIGIKVTSSANVIINDSSNITNGLDTDYKFFFIVEDNSEFSMNDSALSFCGWDRPTNIQLSYGFLVYTNNAEFYRNNFNDNFVPTILGNGIFIEENNFTESDCGLLINGDNNKINKNNFNENYHYGLDIKGDNNILNENSFSNTFVQGLAFSSPSQNNIVNNSIIFNNLNGVWFVSPNNQISLCNISGNDIGIDFYSNSSVINSIIENSGNYDIYSTAMPYSPEFVLDVINTSFDKSKTYFDFGGAGSPVGKIVVKWYLDVNVTNATSGLSGANVLSYDNDENLVFSEATDSTGFIETQNLTEYFENATGKYFYTNFSLNASKSPYRSDFREFNLTESMQIDVILNSMPEVSNVVLNSSTGENRSSDNLTVYYDSFDADLDDVTTITDWRINDTSIALVNMPFDTNVEGVGEIVKDYSSFENNWIIGYNFFTEQNVPGASPVWEISEKVGGAYKFDGVNDFIFIDEDNMDNLQNVTISAWIKPEMPTDISGDFAWGIVAVQGANNYRIAIRNDSNIVVDIEDRGLNIEETGFYWQENVWQHVVLVSGPGETSFYSNGQKTILTTDTSLIEDPSPWFIGLRYPFGLHYKGTIDEVMIFNRSLSEAQVKEIYNSGIAEHGIEKIVSDETNYGENWTVMLTPNDGYGDGESVLSNWLLLVNHLPEVSNVVLNSSTGENRSSDNLTVYYDSFDFDLDDVSTIIDWRINDASIALLNMPFDTNVKGVGEIVKDYSSFENNGTIYGNPVWEANGKIGGAYTFDGVDDYIEIDNISKSSQEELSVEAWVYVKKFNDEPSTVSTPIISDWRDFNENSQKGFLLRASHTGAGGGQTGWNFYVNNASSDFYGAYADTQSDAAFSDKYANKWIHIVGVFKANEFLKIYIDGEIEGTELSNVPNSFVPELTKTDLIGRSDINYGFLNGTIDEVRVYNRSLSEAQVKEIYNSGIAEHGIEKIVSDETNYGENWTVMLTPNDGYGDGESVLSNWLLLVNHLPEVSNVVLNSSTGENRSSDNLTVYYDSFDFDLDDVSTIIDWRINDASIALLNMPFDTNVKGVGEIVKDYSSFENNGTIYGNPVWEANGKIGGAYTFDGVDDYIEISNPGNVLDGESLSISAWIYADDWDTYFPRIVDRVYDEQFAFYVYGGSNELTWALATAGGDVDYANTGTTTISTGEWVHVVLTYDQSDVKLYVNGSLEDTYGEGISGGLDSSSSEIRIGERVEDGEDTRAWDGKIDEVMIFNRSLSEAQVKEIYNSGIAEHGIEKIISDETNYGENWTAMLTPNDGYGDGESVLSNWLKIRNVVTCGDKITKPGRYVVEADVSNYEDSNDCIYITSSNVFLDCQGHTLDGTDVWSDWGINGIQAYGSLGNELLNVTIFNCTLNDWKDGLVYKYVNNSFIEEVNSYSGLNFLFSLINSNNNSISYCKVDAGGNYGIYLDNSNQNNFSFVNLTNGLRRINLLSSDNNLISNSFISNHRNGGLILQGGIGNIVENTTIKDSLQGHTGILFYGDSSSNIVRNNFIINNTYGIKIASVNANGNYFYNNLFNNTNNFDLSSGLNNFWNTTLDCTGEKNIFNMDCIGGNYWGNATGEDYSDTCRDLDQDGICDEPYDLLGDGSNIDYLPLTNNTNVPPTVELVSPENETSLTNRAPTFVWDGTDLDDDPLIYQLNISCYPACSVDNKLIDVDSESYALTNYLNYFADDGYYYLWTVRASDDDGATWGDWADEFVFNISSVVSINLTVDEIDFGMMEYDGSNETTDNNPGPFVLENDGNCFVNVSVNATDLWDTQPNPSDYFNFKIGSTNEVGAFDFLQSLTSWTQVPNIFTSLVSIVNFNWENVNDSARIDLNITAPGVTETPEPKTSTITFVATRA